MKRIALFLVLVAVLAVGVVFADTEQDARISGYQDGYGGSPSRSPYTPFSTLDKAYNNGYNQGREARLNQSQNQRALPLDFNKQQTPEKDPSLLPPGVRGLDPSIAEQLDPDYKEPGMRIGGTIYGEF